MTELSSSRPTTKRDHRLLLLYVMSGLAVILTTLSLVLSFTGAYNNYDPDYSDISKTMCLNNPSLPRDTTAPYPADNLMQIGYTAENRYLKATVTQPAEQEKKVLNKNARGVYVVVSVQVAFVMVPYQMQTQINEDDFQLVDRMGSIHCIIDSVTRQLSNTDNSPQSFYLWSSSWPTDGSPFALTLVFDVDPSMVSGAYLRVPSLPGDMGIPQATSLSLGLP